jgi:serine/threonine-protein kinase
MSALLQMVSTALAPREFLAAHGEIFTEFGRVTQDSGNISYGLRTADGQRYFVKTPGAADDAPANLAHAQRVELLRNAARIARIVDGHPAAPRLYQVIESPAGPMLIYEWRDGELLHARREERDRPESAHQRFRRLSADQITAALDAVIDLHALLGARGYVAIDFYDGALIYDFEARRVTVCDMDHYHQSPFTNTMGRMLGSSRFMSPEEFQLGATIDQRTTVFTLGRMIAIFLGDGTLQRPSFRGSQPQFELMQWACQPRPGDRPRDIAEFATAWMSWATG